MDHGECRDGYCAGARWPRFVNLLRLRHVDQCYALLFREEITLHTRPLNGCKGGERRARAAEGSERRRRNALQRKTTFTKSVHARRIRNEERNENEEEKMRQNMEKRWS